MLPGPQRQPVTGLLTVVTTCTLADPSDSRRSEFESRFLAYLAWTRAQHGFDSHQAVRLADRPEMYVDLARWRSPGQYRRVCAGSAHRAHLEECRELATVDTELSCNLVRAGRQVGSDGAPVVVVEWLRAEGMNLESLDAAYGAYARALTGRDGFHHADLSRSLSRPGSYTFVTWWQDHDAWRAARREAPAAGAAEPAVHLTARATPAESPGGDGPGRRTGRPEPLAGPGVPRGWRPPSAATRQTWPSPVGVDRRR